MKISIITAVYNQLPMNRLFLESVRASTRSEWELIVVDNGSSDGSAEFFEQADKNIKVIRNGANYSYPYCQNRGAEAAAGEVLAFFNNDIALSDAWDLHLLEILGHDGYEALTLSSNDKMLSDAEAHRFNRRFKRWKYPLLTLFGVRKWNLRLLLPLTYGNFRRHCRRLWERDGRCVRPGFAGSAVVMTRRGYDLLGPWDETQQGGDFDLFYRSVERWLSHGDVRPLSVAGGVYHHHFSRLTFRKKFPRFADFDNLRTLEEKWTPDRLRDYDRFLLDPPRRL